MGLMQGLQIKKGAYNRAWFGVRKVFLVRAL